MRLQIAAYFLFAAGNIAFASEVPSAALVAVAEFSEIEKECHGYSISEEGQQLKSFMRAKIESQGKSDFDVSMAKLFLYELVRQRKQISVDSTGMLSQPELCKLFAGQLNTAAKTQIISEP